MRYRPLCLVLAALAMAADMSAETGYDGWLRYAEIDDAIVRQRYGSLPASVMVLGDSPVLRAAQGELVRGVRGMLARTLRFEDRLPSEAAVVLGTLDAIGKALPAARLSGELPLDGYWLKTASVNGIPRLIITGPNDRGVLYGVFALLRKIGLHQPVSELDEKQAPYAPVRWVNEWNNLDGTIERGYGGLSIFFANDNVRSDLGRVRDYARLLASLGINGCTINNVNANPRAITTEFLPQIARVAEVFRPWGVRLSLSLDFSSPRSIGGLDTFDPLDARVVQWWKDKVDEIYRLIPDFGGFVIKADSEGRLGPSAYGRTHADATNVIARPLKAHGGLLFYRGFVYDHKMDWRNLKNDRARAAYDNFKPLDGQFEDNAVIQIKNGPIDFQVREPASPLFGALEKTNQVVELQITQEYLGQQRQLCYLVPMWKEVLDFDLQAKGAGTPVKALVAGKIFNRPVGGFVGVSNVGLDTNWLGHHLAMANLYGFGRLAWNPDLSAREIVDEWTRLTFGHDKRVVDTIVNMQLSSWRTLENYTGPLGAQTLTDIIGPHYGPAVEASERNGWGQWHRADEKGIGMDRTVATGTGFIGQYRPPVAKIYESLKDCPDELLLWMHHVPYTHVLHSGKTVIQHIYDTHYQGAEEAAAWVPQWKSLKGRVDEQRYHEVLVAATIPGRSRRGVAGCGVQLVLAHVRHPRHQGPRRPFPRPHGGGVHEARGLPGGGCHALGGGLREQGRPMRGTAVRRKLPLRGRGGLARYRRPVLRPERWCLPLPVVDTGSVGRGVGGRRYLPNAAHRRPLFHAPHHRRNCAAARRRDSHRGLSRTAVKARPWTTSRYAPTRTKERKAQNAQDSLDFAFGRSILYFVQAICALQEPQCTAGQASRGPALANDARGKGVPAHKRFGRYPAPGRSRLQLVERVFARRGPSRPRHCIPPGDRPGCHLGHEPHVPGGHCHLGRGPRQAS